MDSKNGDVIPNSVNDCNNCKHNGTWTCIKCNCFDKYERGNNG